MHHIYIYDIYMFDISKSKFVNKYLIFIYFTSKNHNNNNNAVTTPLNLCWFAERTLPQQTACQRNLFVSPHWLLCCYYDVADDVDDVHNNNNDHNMFCTMLVYWKIQICTIILQRINDNNNDRNNINWL